MSHKKMFRVVDMFPREPKKTVPLSETSHSSSVQTKPLLPSQVVETRIKSEPLTSPIQ